MNKFTHMEEFQNILRQRGETVTCAESCTGGLISSMITEISGSSNIFRGSVVTYCNEVKEQELNVKKETMIKYGAVSTQTVEEMLIGVLNKFDADYAMAVSGVAGPTGGTKDKPVGTVVVGVMSKKGLKDIDIYCFNGTRKEVQIQAANMAFERIFKICCKNP
ncbi:MAG: CinA family protein [Campylobacterota bacterium]|nr:CinA family protein [Campylobacterota bacterium]